jgi:serine/threonine protein kinase
MFASGQQIGPYCLVRELGRGAFGVVWLADRRGSLATTQVALKLPLSEEVDIPAIQREAELWVRASGHPNVLPVIEAEVYSGQVVIVSEFAPDGTLGVWLRRNGGKAPTQVAATGICSGILQGLSHLHSRKVVHRDLKPGNILLQGDTPRIADFGLARVVKSVTAATQGIAGTPAYMAPEAWDGVRSEQTDLWAVGIILFELLAGKRPFPQSDLVTLRNAICNAEPDSLPGNIPEKYALVVSRALQKDPVARYQSAAQMLAHLRGELLPIPSTIVTQPDYKALLKKFRLLPKRLAGTELLVSFKNYAFRAASVEESDALGLPIGDTIRAYVGVENSDSYYCYAQGQIAEQVLEIGKDARVTARIRLIFGESRSVEWGDAGPVGKPESHSGFLILEVIGT